MIEAQQAAQASAADERSRATRDVFRPPAGGRSAGARRRAPDRASAGPVLVGVGRRGYRRAAPASATTVTEHLGAREQCDHATAAVLPVRAAMLRPLDPAQPRDGAVEKPAPQMHSEGEALAGPRGGTRRRQPDGNDALPGRRHRPGTRTGARDREHREVSARRTPDGRRGGRPGRLGA
jgi:hypothetical protein